MTDEQLLLSKYKNCCLCHRRCDTDRTKQTGFCGMPDGLFAARAALHYWEEPCISGECGSGTVFFSGCSLRCVFCQNHDIALGLSGKTLDTGRLAEIFLELQEKGAANINLVTPTHYAPSIVAALDRAQSAGLFLPVVYNTGNYETVETLRMLEGYVDVYLPDFKYWSAELAKRCCGAPDYAEAAKENIAEMFRQVGAAQFAAKPFSDRAKFQKTQRNAPTQSESCFMVRGIIVRHLALPGALSDSKKIIRYLYETYGNDIYLSIMNQYTPIAKNLAGFPELNRKLTPKEYDGLIDFAVDLGVENAFIQEGETAEESFIPSFCGEGV
ncbi:MAG: radical SAM protein [Lachnospiraceae bacterium]|nr:radical SAM protein [Lachnospiraceae bacterium]